MIREAVRKFTWWHALGVIPVVLILAVITITLVQPDVPGRWCKESEAWFTCFREWQTLIAGLLALGGAVLVLLAAQLQVEGVKTIAAEAEEERIRAARMKLAYQLELFVGAYEDVLKEIAMPGLPPKIPPMYLPQPTFDFGDLTRIPPGESEDLLGFAHDIATTNSILFRLSSKRGLAAYYARRRAAKTILTAVEWRNRYADKIGWKEMNFSEKRRRELLKTIDNDTRKIEEKSARNSDSGDG